MQRVERLTNIYNELSKVKDFLMTYSKQEGSSHPSISNLKHYIALRSIDMANLQDELTKIGLSSLGRSQSCVLSSINQDLNILETLLRHSDEDTLHDEIEPVSFEEAQKLHKNNTRIFGPSSQTYKTSIMVTLPSEAAQSKTLISSLISNGAAVLRINTAHDGAASWKKMAQFIHEANQELNKSAQIYVDLAGPKNRTTKIARIFSPLIVGSKKEPQEVLLVPKSTPLAMTKPQSEDSLGNILPAVFVVDDTFYEHCKKVKSIEIENILKQKSNLCPLITTEVGIFCRVEKKITILENTTLILERHKKRESTHLHNFLLSAQEIRLYMGDQIIITENDIDGQAKFSYDSKEYSAIIGCSNKEVFAHVKKGDKIFIDDGKIGCRAIDRNEMGIVCEIEVAKENGTVLKEEKGINFPDTDLAIKAITSEDEKNFEEIVGFADMIGISFAQTAEDIKQLQTMLAQKNKEHIAIVPKIETKTAIHNLPEILAQLLESKHFAVMIARGDLAIEVGFEYLPYIQEEIFDICESAHVPVIYATQILESKMKKNLPSRAEVTDAALAQRADCVMLNKGPFVIDTVIILKNILRNMHRIFQKNRQLLHVCETWKINQYNAPHKLNQ